MRRFRTTDDRSITVTSEELTAMDLDGLKELGLSLGLGMEGVTSVNQAMGLLLGNAREIVDF